LSSKVASQGDQGLLGIAFHPLYYATGRFFVSYTRTSDGALVVSEFKVSANANVADPTEKVILTIPHPGSTTHNGGTIAFGPDRYLYMATGDGGGTGDSSNNAQNANSLLGKILRIDIDSPDPGAGYSSPSDNPYVGKGGRAEVYALGFRNPRMSFD